MVRNIKLYPLIIIFVLILSFGFAKGQSVVGEWQNYTSSLYMQEGVNYHDYLYIATTGGLLTFSTVNNQFDNYKKPSGLSSLEINSIAIDDNNMLWLGMAEGEINFFDVKAKQTAPDYVRNYDINSFQKELNNVSVIRGNGNSFFAACQRQRQWGLIHFVKEKQEYLYKDYYFKFPDNINVITDLLLENNIIYLATGSGILAGDFINSNLKSPEQWEMIDNSESLNIGNLVESNGSIYFVGDKNLFKLEENRIIKLDNQQNGKIKKVYPIDAANLGLLVNSGVYNYNLKSEQASKVISNNAIDLITGESSNLFGITEGQGLWVYDGEHTDSYIPNTLISNKFSSISIGKKGQIAAASSKGLSFSTENGWYNVVRTNDYEQLFKGLTINEVDPNYFSACSLAYNLTSDGKIWSLVKRKEKYYATLHRSSIRNKHKGGLLTFDPDHPQNYTVYDTTNNVLTASAGIGEGSETYMVPAGMKLDNQGNLWIINQYAQNGNVITVLDNNDEWHHFSIKDFDGLTHFLNDMAFDSNQRVWFSSTTWSGDPYSHGGIFMLDFNGTLADKSDDSWKRFDKSEGLESNNVFSLDIDQTGTLWIMTIAGIQKAEVVNSDLNFMYFNNGKYNLFSNLSFAKFCRLQVDLDNNIWFSTEDEGVKIYSKKGEWLPLGDLGDSLDYSEGFTEDNSDILSNTVLDFDFNEEEGKVYFATDKGISVLKYRYPVMQKNYKELT
ncbi:MAG: hypothetical protein K9M80_05195, partial [Candidatus Marinimicrobia bacterium]|nr:hypothetical protein [Candidatus Neomarinimicrobiota bacterium]